ncbi:GtrA family protein [Planomonospora corallina]|uniref:GtrA family protein n=1 Tax=Planomonospora corallina TaxID=1806052 RepID=A0ABV8I5Y8_9ACTN
MSQVAESLPRVLPAPEPPFQDRRTPLKLLLFLMIGGVSTLLYVGLYALLRQMWSPMWANLVALIGTALINTEANRRWTFVRAKGSRTRQHLRAAVIFVIYYGTTTAMIEAGHALFPHVPWIEVTTLLATCGGLTVLRYVALDRWVFPS